jgi:L1 cell adhesion molecule like protein
MWRLFFQAWDARQAGGMTQLLEPSLFDTPQLKEIERCVEVGLLCTQFDPADRPDMVGALQMLRGEKALRIPVRPRYTKELTNWFGGLSCLQVRL